MTESYAPEQVERAEQLADEENENSIGHGKNFNVDAKAKKVLCWALRREREKVADMMYDCKAFEDKAISDYEKLRKEISALREALRMAKDILLPLSKNKPMHLWHIEARDALSKISEIEGRMKG